jgi:hypothetical protein
MAGIADFLQGMFRPPQAQQTMNADPMQGMGGFQRLQYMQQNNPEALMGLASGLMQGNLGGGFAAAGQAMGDHRREYAQQAEKTRTNDLTRKWLLGRGLSESDADAALANPAIMQDLMKAPAGPEFMNVGDGNIFRTDTQEFIRAPGTTQEDDYSVRARKAAEMGLSQDDPRYQPFVLTGKFPREDSQEMTATDKKAMWGAEDEIPLLDNSLSTLQRAKELNKKTFTGYTAGVRGDIGTKIPGGDWLFDGKAAQATSEFNKIMSMEAIQAMAATLKGATTDSELARFVSILADPSADPDIRERTIDRMIQLTERVKQVKQQRIQSIRGDAPAQGVPGASRTTKTGVSYSVNP